MHQNDARSLTPLLQELLNELGSWCGTSTIQDYKYILDRVKHEGSSFLTITLPTYAKDLEKGLERGKVDRSLFQGLTWKRGLPRFLGGFLGHVFDRETGILLDDANVDAIFAVRQICMAYGKIALPCSDARKDAAFRQYVQTERDVRFADQRLGVPEKVRFQHLARMLWTSIFTEVDGRVYNLDVLPKHGPGATADKLSSNAKWNQREWPERLETVFPSSHPGILTTSWSRILSGLPDVHTTPPGDERPVRVIAVPKTLKTPRLIAIEPAAMQYMQQGILNAVVEAIEADDTASWLIGFMTQVPNQVMAQKGSSDGSLATLDLSEASDRVSNQHVRLLLDSHPHLFNAVDATRSRKADVPGHGVIRLAKFASMGSALCFPFEAMVFATVVLLGIERGMGHRLTRRDLASLRGQVRVYGDDIIVPVEYVHSVISALEDFGLRVNTGKSFWDGKFRESCGRDYFAGSDVSVTRVRREFPSSRQRVLAREQRRNGEALHLISLVKLRNQLYQAGLWNTAFWLDQRIERLIPFPLVSKRSQVQGRHSVAFGPDQDNPWRTEPTLKVDTHLQCPLVRGAVVKVRLPEDPLDGDGALIKCLNRLERRTPSAVDEVLHGWGELANESPGMPSGIDHLERAGRPEAVNIKLRWTSPI